MYYVLGDVKSLVFSGKVPVDSLCGLKDNTHVFTEGDDIWDVMLNQVSLPLHSCCTHIYIKYYGLIQNILITAIKYRMLVDSGSSDELLIDVIGEERDFKALNIL